MQRPRVTDIEQQIAQLRWRRQQNERSIRGALEATKVLKQKDTILGITVDYSAEKSMWTNSIVRDELSRPLIVSDEELHQIEYDEAKIKKRLLKVSLQSPIRRKLTMYTRSPQITLCSIYSTQDNSWITSTKCWQRRRRESVKLCSEKKSE